MITLRNQLALQFTVGNITDFLDIEDFHYMRIAENAGGLRPLFEMNFTVSNEGIIPYLNSGNIISLMYGVNEPTSDLLQFQIMGDSKNKEYHVGSTISLEGAMYNPGFTGKTRSITYYNKKSYEALNLLASQNGMRFVSNVTRTNDAQNWYQNGITDWNMTNYVAPRAYRDSNTFFAYGFDNNNFYFYDIKEYLKQGPKWILSVRKGGGGSANIINIGTYFCDDSNAGQNADLAGKNVTNVGYNLDTGEISNPGYNLKTFTTMDTKKVNVNSTGCQSYNYMITTGDEHDYTIQAVNQNKRNNILYSSYTCYVPVTGVYRDFRLFDIVQLVPAETDKEAEGIYFITGIAKEYKDMQYITMLTLNRESANGIRGDLEGGA